MAELLGRVAPDTNPDRAKPLYFDSGVACGWPSPAADYEEAPLSIDELVGITAASTFLVRAIGDSMYPLIRAGDVLVVDRSKTAEFNDVVVAVVEGEFTVKRLVRVAGKPALVAENPNHEYRFQGGEEGIDIWGVVSWNLHRLRACHKK